MKGQKLMSKSAKPIWLKNRHKTKNLQVGFRCNFNAVRGKNYILNITGATFYKIYLNGEFIGCGPARAPHGYIRTDELRFNVKDGLNRLAVEVAGYNCPSFYTLKIESFLYAEVTYDNVPIAYTGKDFSVLSLEKNAEYLCTPLFISKNLCRDLAS